MKMKCARCGKEIVSKPIWVKKMAFVLSEIDTDDFEALAEWGRREFAKMVNKDVTNKEKTGESFYCEDCFQEI